MSQSPKMAQLVHQHGTQALEAFVATISNANGACEPCPPNTFITGNTCASCNVTLEVDHAGQCCAHDLTIDLSTLTDQQLYCNAHTLPAGSASEASCGLEVMHLNQLSTVLSSGPGEIQFSVQPGSEASCVGVTYALELRLNNGAAWVPFATLVATGQTFDPFGGCTFDAPIMMAVSTAQIAGGLTEVVATVRALTPSTGASTLRMETTFSHPACEPT